MEETEVLGENHRPVASHWQTLSYNVVSSTPRMSGIRTQVKKAVLKFNVLIRRNKYFRFTIYIHSDGFLIILI
jgi:hypothetical protein